MNKRIQIGRAAFCFWLIATASLSASGAETWKPAQGPLLTRWAKDVSPKNALPEYPRPQLVRKDWLNLNGLWDYAIQPRDGVSPVVFEGKILVPFPVESALSGVMRKIGDTNRLWYRRTLEIPAAWRGKRVLLHFGAVDWDTSVMVNGREVGKRQGGYDGFSFDITDALKSTGPQELTVAVWDPTDTGAQPRGKQVNRPGGIWYTAVTGIWQTVWLEPVPDARIDSVKIVPDVDASQVVFTVNAVGPSDLTVQVRPRGRKASFTPVTGKSGEPIRVGVKNPHLWSPDDPFLYEAEILLVSSNAAADSVGTYFGMRKIALGKDERGVNRLFLNNKPLFQFGPLDQGWWPDGLYTAPTDDALRYDIEVTKKLGFNMARKHVKVEPERWYYWCDKLGLLVWQDMPSAMPARRRGANNQSTQPTPEAAQQFELELKRDIDGRGNHPSIVMWVPFNEGWGQYDTERITAWVKNYDPTRLVNNASGWTDRNVGDVIDMHKYPGPGSPPRESARAAVLGEFGGLGLPLSGHTWQSQANWGYQSYSNRQELTDAYIRLIGKLHPLAGTPGLAAAVYTQTSDVEVEVNGLMTYDRAIIKADERRIAAANRKLYTPPPPAPIVRTLVPASREQGMPWRYTTNKPADSWNATGFDDSSWRTGNGGFGTRGTPGASVRTEWNTADIWLRREFELPPDFKPGDPHLLLHHDEDVEVYLNGKLVFKAAGYIGDYDLVELSKSAQGLLKPGRNLLAVHCHQTTGGQYVDVGLVNLESAGKNR